MLAEWQRGGQLPVPCWQLVNGPPATDMQMADLLCACQEAAGNRILQTYMKNHQHSRWFFIFRYDFVFQAARGGKAPGTLSPDGLRKARQWGG